MKIHRFIGQFNLKVGRLLISDKNIAHQIRNVLKLTTSEKIILCQEGGAEAVAEIISLNKDFLEVKIESISHNPGKPGKKVTLYCAILKKENFELVAQKATEVGITEIVPIITDRTVKQGIREERLLKIMKEASELSGRRDIPTLGNILDFNTAIEIAKRHERCYLFDISGVKEADFAFGDIGLFVGPEGGWSEKETEKARSSNLEIISLGDLVLRGETAAIIVSFLATRV